MKLASVMIAGSVFSAGVLTLFTEWSPARELWLGMLAPLAVTSLEWVVLEQTHGRSPERMTSLMLAAFFAKIVFFGAYVAALVGAGLVQPTPFIASFVGFFVALLVMEAFGLHRLTACEPAPGN